jgi:hypothetical protein
MKTLAIAGAGKRPRHGLLNPKKFGLNGFQAALIARYQEKLDESLSIVYRPERIKRWGWWTMSIENKIEYKILDTGCILVIKYNAENVYNVSDEKERNKFVEFLEAFLSATEKAWQ